MNTPAVEPDTTNASSHIAPTRRSLRTRLARGVAGFLWACLAVTAAWSLFAWLFPQNLEQAHAPLKLLNILAFAGQVLRFHLAIACAVAAVLALLVWRPKLAAASLLVGGLLALPTGLTWLPKSPPAVAGGTLRVQTVNLLSSNYRPGLIFADLDAADADVIVLQEFHTWHDQFVTPHLAANYPYHVAWADTSTRGMAVFSKTPILESTPDGQEVRLGEHTCRAQRVVVEFEGRPLAIYNVHPQSPGTFRAIVMGQRQLGGLLDLLRHEPLAHVVAGDFNASTGTANLNACLDEGLREAQATAGVGPGWTWPRKEHGRVQRYLAKLPGIRIDQCFFSPELTATDAAVGEYHGSNHLSVVADLGWKR